MTLKSRAYLKWIIPLFVTVVCLYFAFNSINFADLAEAFRRSNHAYIFLAFLGTLLSYLLRSLRWCVLFPKNELNWKSSYKILNIGFFMNNVLPARTGELVRAHLGARSVGLTRTSVLATIFVERLVDGLTLSLFIGIFGYKLADKSVGDGLNYVALLFLSITIAIAILLIFRDFFLKISSKLLSRIKPKFGIYIQHRLEQFIHGLTPIFSLKKGPTIILSSLLIWSVELGVFTLISEAFGKHLLFAENVIFLVAVNFSSLIPAAPGGIGVIELIVSRVLISLGVPPETALACVLTQHLMQYVAVASPAIISFFFNGGLYKEVSSIENSEKNSDNV